jgi:hypothetical protein
MERAELQRPGRAQRQGHQHRPLGAGGVHDRQRVGGELGWPVGLGARRPVGAAVAAAVEGDHPVAAGQVGNLQLPVPRVDDGPGRQQQHGRLAGAEHLVVDLDPLALDVAGTDGLACTHLGPPWPYWPFLVVGRSTDLDNTAFLQHTQPTIRSTDRTTGGRLMPETTDPPSTASRPTSSPAPTRPAAPRPGSLTAAPGDPATARWSTSRPAATAATGSRRWSTRSISSRFPPRPAHRWRPSPERANRTHR